MTEPEFIHPVQEARNTAFTKLQDYCGMLELKYELTPKEINDILQELLELRRIFTG